MGGELVQSPRVDLHGPGRGPSHDEQIRSSEDMQTPNTVLVWIDGAWSGEPVSCKPLFAGGGRLKNHAIDCAESEPMGDVGLSLEAGPRYLRDF